MLSLTQEGKDVHYPFKKRQVSSNCRRLCHDTSLYPRANVLRLSSEPFQVS